MQSRLPSGGDNDLLGPLDYGDLWIYHAEYMAVHHAFSKTVESIFAEGSLPDSAEGLDASLKRGFDKLDEMYLVLKDAKTAMKVAYNANICSVEREAYPDVSYAGVCRNTVWSNVYCTFNDGTYGVKVTFKSSMWGSDVCGQIDGPMGDIYTEAKNAYLELLPVIVKPTTYDEYEY